jgi:hypothetical protein
VPYYGYGASATGGAGGTTIHVTNLNNDGAGSLRDACENYTVPREIVFDVGGNILLKDPGGSRPHGIYMTSVNGDVTIRGESAPYPVTVKLDHSGASSPPAQEDQYPAFQLEGVDNVIFSHIAIRPTMWPYEVGEYANAESHQAISLDSCTNVVIDHCTLSDVQARCISSSGSSNNTDVTVSWCIFSDGYEDRPGSPGTAGKGISLHPGDTRWSIFNNVFTHLHSRMPQVIGDSDVRGNVVYNWRQDGAIVYNTVGNSRVNFTDHWTKTGPDSVGQETKGALNAFDWRTHPTYPSAGTLQIYVDDGLLGLGHLRRLGVRADVTVLCAFCTCGDLAGYAQLRRSLPERQPGQESHCVDPVGRRNTIRGFHDGSRIRYPMVPEAFLFDSFGVIRAGHFWRGRRNSIRRQTSQACSPVRLGRTPPLGSLGDRVSPGFS